MIKSAVIVTGGAGYIGSHIVLALVKKGYTVIVIDHVPVSFDITTILQETGGKSICADYADTQTWEYLDTLFNLEAVIHCAAYINVNESVLSPSKYYENNVLKLISLLSTLKTYQIKNIVFSSSCAVYGNPLALPVEEGHLTYPLSPYGNSKLMGELLIKDYARAYAINYGILRYFNAAGATPEHNLGERHDPEFHIIPLLIEAALERRTFKLYGTDYDTPDGTCIRDYIHVSDLAHAHVLALEYLIQKNDSFTANVGTGKGYSVLEVMKAVQNVIGFDIPIEEHSRRIGDAPILYAGTSTAMHYLTWQAHDSTLEKMVSSAYHFYVQAMRPSHMHTIKEMGTLDHEY